jgi:hypothetical protein
VLGGGRSDTHHRETQDRQRKYKGSIDARSLIHCCHGKAISSTYYECVFVAIGIQHARRMRRIMLSSVAFLALPCFSTLYQNQ